MILKYPIAGGAYQFIGENADWLSMAISSDGTKILLCRTTTDQLYYSSDGGTTLTKIGASRTWTKVMASSDFSILYAKTGDTLYKSTDYGQNWSSVLSKGANALYDCAVSSNGLVIYAIYYLISGNYYFEIVKSANAGVSWGTPSKTSITYQYGYKITCSTSGTIAYAGTQSTGSTAITTDGGANWTAYAGGGTVMKSSDDGSFCLCAGTGTAGTMYKFLSNGTRSSYSISNSGWPLGFNSMWIVGNNTVYANAQWANYSSTTYLIQSMDLGTGAQTVLLDNIGVANRSFCITVNGSYLYNPNIGTNYVQALCAKRYYNGAWDTEKELMGVSTLANTAYYYYPKVSTYDTEKVLYWGSKYTVSPTYGVDIERKEGGVYLTPELDILSGVSANLSAVTKRGVNGTYWYVYLSTDQKICYAKRWNGSSWDNAETVFSKASAMSQPRVSMNSSGNIAVSVNYGSILVRRRISGSWGAEGSISPGSYTCTNTDHLFIDTSNNVSFVGRRVTAMQYGFVLEMAWWHWMWNGSTFTTYAVSFPWCYYVNGNYYYDQNYPVFDSKPTGEIILFAYGVQGLSTPVWSHAYFSSGSWSNLTSSSAATSYPSDICYNSNNSWSVIAGYNTLQINTWSGSWSGWSTFATDALNRGAAIVQDSQSRWHTVYTRQISRPIITPTPEIVSFIKSIDTHLRAVIKTVDGVPLASIKKVNDLT